MYRGQKLHKNILENPHHGFIINLMGLMAMAVLVVLHQKKKKNLKVVYMTLRKE
jgi:hypothetical protein